MGKLKSSRSLHRMPRWQTSENLAAVHRSGGRHKLQWDPSLQAHKRGDWEECIDASLAQAIQQIAKEQQEEMEHFREDCDEELLLRKTKSLAIGMDCAQAGLASAHDADVYTPELHLADENEAVLAQFVPVINQEAYPSLGDTVIAHRHKMGANTNKHGVIHAHNPRVVQLYTRLGAMLRQYHAGMLPKAFQIVASLPHWEELMQLTRPEGWSHAALFETTRLFVTHAPTRCLQRFVTSVLLPSVRKGLAEHRQLDLQQSQTLALVLQRRPLDFLRGLVVPLCQLGCTLDEAARIGELMQSQPIGRMHAALGLEQLALLPYLPATSLFLRLLIPKAHAAHYRTIDALLYHFCHIKDDRRTMPVVWHQALLAFVEHCRYSLVQPAFTDLLGLLERHAHPDLSPPIRRLLQAMVQLDKHYIPLPVGYSSDTISDSETDTASDTSQEESHDRDTEEEEEEEDSDGPDSSHSHISDGETRTDTASDMSVDM